MVNADDVVQLSGIKDTVFGDVHSGNSGAVTDGKIDAGVVNDRPGFGVLSALGASVLTADGGMTGLPVRPCRGVIADAVRNDSIFLYRDHGVEQSDIHQKAASRSVERM